MKNVCFGGGAGVLLLGLALLANFGATSGGEGGKPKASQVLEKITLTPERAKASGLDPALSNPAIHLGPTTAELKSHKVDAEPVEKKDLTGKVFASGLQYTCDPRFLNRFTVGGQPLKARQFSYTVETISWQAGDGWPVYSTFCPNPGYHTSMYYPAAKIHQIVPSIDGQNYFVGCLQSGVCASSGSGQICFAVNDNQYPDNRGYFVVTIYGIVP